MSHAWHKCPHAPTMHPRMHLGQLYLAGSSTGTHAHMHVLCLHVGLLMAQSIRRTEYERLSNGTVITKSLNCDLTGMLHCHVLEQAG
jgi:hypothetical protein